MGAEAGVIEGKTAQHRVNRVVFDLQFADTAMALVTRTQLEELLEDTLIPAMDEVFTDYASGSQIHRIGRLEVDLGRLDPGQTDTNRIRDVIVGALVRRLRALSAADIRTEATETSLEAALRTFLVRGYLPWQSIWTEVSALEAAMLALEPPLAAEITFRLRPLISTDTASRRVVHQFSPELFDWLLGRLHDATAQELRALGRQALSEMELPAAQAILLRAIATVDADAALEDVRAAAHRIARASDSSAHTRVFGENDGRRDKPVGARIPEQARGLPTPDEPPIPEEPPIPDDAEVLEDALYTRYAGIVLVHPFLEQFFNRLDLVGADKRFRSPAAGEKAVHLLHFLASGQSHPQEHQTVLYKLLCGLPLSEPIAKDLSLSDEEKAEAVDLLTAAIDHWEALKRTSPDGLREGFLQREGKLSRIRSGWKLVVEQRSIDILLDQLWWSVSTVRLPWMADPLHVDWI